MLKKYSILLLFTFLIFPKIPFTSRSGILVGEILLAILPLLVLLRVGKTSFSLRSDKIIYIFLIFLYIYILGGSVLAAVDISIFPANATAQYVRVLLYSQLVLLVSSNAVQGLSSNDFYRLIKNSYLAHALLSISYYVYSYNITQPTLADIIGTAAAGARLIPMYGLTVAPNNGLLLNAVSGGSGNLLATHSLFVLILASQFEKDRKVEAIISFFAVFSVLLAQSRGGFLTILFWLIFRGARLLHNSDKNKTMSLIYISAILSLLTLIIITLPEELGIFYRYQDIVSGEGLDGSSSARIENYREIMAAWINSPLSIIFGLGFDGDILERSTNWTIVESLFLSVLFCGGILAALMLLLFYLESYLIRGQTVWSSVLYKFLIFNALINWTVTGGDLLGPPSLFFVFTTIGLHLRSLSISESLSPKVRRADICRIYLGKK
jgi:hypothetical protein